MTTQTHARYLASSAWAHLRPKRPFMPREDWIRLGGGVVLTAIVGGFVHGIAPAGALMLNVGSFLGSLLCLLPRHHSRSASVIAGLVLVNGGSAVGILLVGHPLITVGVLAVGLFAAGMARAISVGVSMRLTFASITLLAAGELASSLSSPDHAWPGLGLFVVGQLIVALCGCVGHSRRSLADQRMATAELYRQLLALAAGAESRVMRARVLARQSVELTTLLEFADARWIRTLLDAADEIAADLATGPRPDDVRALEWLLAVLAKEAAPRLPDGLDLSPGVRLAVGAAADATSMSATPRDLRSLLPSSVVGFYLRELRDVRGSTLRFAVRLMLTGVLCQLVGTYLIADIGIGLRFHGFWTVLAGCLMAMPDYHGTSGKAIARTAGSIVGAVAGTALSLIPLLQQPAPFLVMAALLVLGFLVARTMGQGMLMLAFILGGEPAAFTLTLDTVVGAVIAAAVFFILPTWNVDRIQYLFEQWCERGRSALTTIAAEAQSPGPLASRAQDQAFNDFVHAQRRFVRAAKVVPLEPRSAESPWPLSSLPLIADGLDRVAVSLQQLHRSAGTQGGAPVTDPHLVEPLAEAFTALASGRAPEASEPPPGALGSLWHDLHRLADLTVH